MVEYYCSSACSHDVPGSIPGRDILYAVIPYPPKEINLPQSMNTIFDEISEDLTFLNFGIELRKRW